MGPKRIRRVAPVEESLYPTEMRIPESLEGLVDHGVIQEVLRPLKSGKEAQVYLVTSGGYERIAKVYKESNDRTFRHRSSYTEGREVRNSRDMRAMKKKSNYGRSQHESEWKSAEVDMIYRLRDAGVRVPEPFNFIDGVLIMELITDAEGHPAPRLGEVVLEPREASDIFETLLRDVVRMLSAGVVHGDLSDFNVLMGSDGPVIIDFPQAVDAARNQNARKILLRDVENLNRFLAQRVPGRPRRPFGEEMWELFKRGELRPDSLLTGKHRGSGKKANVDGLMREIDDAKRDEQRRRRALGLEEIDAPAEEETPKPKRRTAVVMSEPPKSGGRPEGRGPKAQGRGKGRGRGQGQGQGQARVQAKGGSSGQGAGQGAGSAEGEGAPRKRRRRRRRAGGGASGQGVNEGNAQQGARSEAQPSKSHASSERKAAPAGGESDPSAPAKRRRRRRRRSTASKGPDS